MLDICMFDALQHTFNYEATGEGHGVQVHAFHA